MKKELEHMIIMLHSMREGLPSHMWSLRDQLYIAERALSLAVKSPQLGKSEED